MATSDIASKAGGAAKTSTEDILRSIEKSNREVRGEIQLMREDVKLAKKEEKRLPQSKPCLWHVERRALAERSVFQKDYLHFLSAFADLKKKKLLPVFPASQPLFCKKDNVKPCAMGVLQNEAPEVETTRRTTWCSVWPPVSSQHGAGIEADGEEVDGEEVDGEEVDGEEVDGEEVDGEEVDGEEVDGEEADGEEADGEEADGEEVDGEEVDGEEVDGEEADGEE
ncbi:hypothetical protein KUCAC02_016885, partial [Chaenocephalus aceratus]